MSENIIRTDDHTIIFNGGDPLPGCPDSYEEAHTWADAANEKRPDHYGSLEWRFDCGFKLDFDGALAQVNSRFYPPKSHYGPKWNGDVSVKVFGNEVLRQEFVADSLDELREVVESWCDSLRVSVEEPA